MVFRKLFNLTKDDDVCQYVIKRPLPVKDGKKQKFAAPKVQRLVSDHNTIFWWVNIMHGGIFPHQLFVRKLITVAKKIRISFLPSYDINFFKYWKVRLGLNIFVVYLRISACHPCHLSWCSCVNMQVTPVMLQRKRHRLALKRRRGEKNRLAAAEYAKILAQRQKEAKEARELKRKRSASLRESKRSVSSQ